MASPELPRIALVQMEVRPGRPDLNLSRMGQLIDEARGGGAEIVVFSELCLSGYIIGDLWEIDALVRDFASYSDDVRGLSQGLTVVFGNVVVDAGQIGEDGRIRKYNAVLVCADGEYVQRSGLPVDLPGGAHPKALHPNYRFFDDDRHFYSLRKLAQACGRSPYDWAVPYEVQLSDGRPFRFGVQLCEDIWCQDYSCEGGILDTLAVYHQRGAEAVFNLSSSPWTWQKNDKRNRTVREILSGSPVPFYYVNQVGAQNNGKNIIVFDGDTTAYSPAGAVLQRAAPWREQVVLTGKAEEVAPHQGETEAVYHAILTGLHHMDHVRGGENRFLVGVSGGIDSSVVACMLTQAFGPDRVFAVNMPTRFNATITQDNARLVCEDLGIDYLSCPIEELYQQVAALIEGVVFPRSSGTYDQLVDENIQARIRFSDILAGIAAKHGLIFTNNGNKTELALGYCTLYGDLGGAIAPIADLYKGQVYSLGEYLNREVYSGEVIPQNLLSGETVPSAELSASQDVTRGLGDPIKYGYHDAVLRQLIEYRHHPADLIQWFIDGQLLERLDWNDLEAFRGYFADADAWLEDLDWLARQVRTSFFKRIQAPPLIVLSKRAFGFDLRETQWPEYEPRGWEELRLLARQQRL
ncbi:NAD(+) synthase [Candidatus Latescibacterota bacterium]